MKIGANLAGMMQNYQHSSGSPTISSVLGTRDTVGSIFPGHPSFLFARAKGFNIGNAGWEHVIAVNQVGQRFYNERAIRDISSDAKYPPGTDGTRKPFTPLDWRNASTGAGQGAIQAVGGGRCGARDERGLAGARLRLGAGLGDLRCRGGRARQMADPLPLYRRPARRVLPQSRYAGGACEESDGASPSEDAAEVPGGDGRAVQRVRRQRQGRGLREAGHAQDRHAALLRGDQRGSACTIPMAAFGSTARRRSSTPTARSSPASMPAARRAAAVRSTASAARRSTATSPGRTRRRSRRSES